MDTDIPEVGNSMARVRKPNDKCQDSQKRRLILIDDHAVMRLGLARLINDQADMCVCGEAANADDALALIDSCNPDLAILDITLKHGTDGIELTKTLRARNPEVVILVLSMHDETIYAERVLRAGAKGYITKQEAPENILAAVRKVLSGEIYLNDKIASRMLNIATGNRKGTEDSALDRLSDRELQVFRLIAEGLSIREIAEKLFLSVKTIETHREHIKEKLKLTSSNQLLRYAVQHGVNNV
jgi:DNA-binding NarL/FixJ family response regulator